MRHRKYVEVEVEFDLAEFDDDELVKEMESRGFVVSKTTFNPGDAELRIYEALRYAPSDSEALRVVREVAQEVTGRLL